MSIVMDYYETVIIVKDGIVLFMVLDFGSLQPHDAYGSLPNHRFYPQAAP